MSTKEGASKSEGTSSRKTSSIQDDVTKTSAGGLHGSTEPKSGLPSQPATTGGHSTTPQKQAETTTTASETGSRESESAQKATAQQASTTSQTEEAELSEPRRQVIAVSASKGPAAFFNLARKFLATDEVCDLSALEGAIVSAVDAAHLLERSKLATIVRVQTSYVTVEPKRKIQHGTNIPPPTPSSPHVASMPTDTTQLSQSGISTHQQQHPPQSQPPTTQQQRASTGAGTKKAPQGRSKGSPLRRARIIITVKRTKDYKTWLEENPHQISGEGDDELDVEGAPPLADSDAKKVGGKPPPVKKS